MGTPRIQTPHIHVLGTPATELHFGYQFAYLDLAVVIRTLVDTAPNVRDYYPLDDWEAKYQQAQSEHQFRVAKLRGVQEELRILMEYCSRFLPATTRVKAAKIPNANHG